MVVFGYSADQANHFAFTASSQARVQPLSSPSMALPVISQCEPVSRSTSGDSGDFESRSKSKDRGLPASGFNGDVDRRGRRRRLRRAVPNDDPVLIAYALPRMSPTSSRPQAERRGLCRRRPLLARTPRCHKAGVGWQPRLLLVRGGDGRQFLRLIFVKHVIGDGLRVVFYPQSPILAGGERRDWLVSLAFSSRSVEGDARQA